MKLSNFLESINWKKVEKIHVTKDGKFTSFAIETGRKKRIVTIGVGPDITTLTVTDARGTVLSHAVQQGDEITFFSPKSS